MVQGRIRVEPDRPAGLLSSGISVGRTLLETFTEAASARNLLAGKPSPGDAFRIVRDMPYRRPKGMPPLALLSDWCGTCSGKHALLAGLLDEMGIENRLMLATYRFRWTGPEPVPDVLVPVLRDGPVPDVHTFLEIRWNGLWTTVDATWPRGAERGVFRSTTGRRACPTGLLSRHPTSPTPSPRGPIQDRRRTASSDPSSVSTEGVGKRSSPPCRSGWPPS